jgi:DNA-binding ferritin-like protein
MMSLRGAYHYAHWNSGRYADHLLFERLYKSLDKDIDTLAELTVYRGVRPLRRVEVSISQIPKAEEAIIRIATEMVENERPSKGMENYLLNLVEHRERAIYLLRMASGQ